MGLAQSAAGDFGAFAAELTQGPTHESLKPAQDLKEL
jgi:hypothetical protein